MIEGTVSIMMHLFSITFSPRIWCLQHPDNGIRFSYFRGSKRSLILQDYISVQTALVQQDLSARERSNYSTVGTNRLQGPLYTGVHEHHIRQGAVAFLHIRQGAYPLRLSR